MNSGWNNAVLNDIAMVLLQLARWWNGFLRFKRPVGYFRTGQTITGDYYANLIGKLIENIKVKRRAKLTKGFSRTMHMCTSHLSSCCNA